MTTVLTDKQVEAILKLLDDDEETWRLVRSQVVGMGSDAVHVIQAAVAPTTSDLVKKRVGELSLDFRRRELTVRLKDLPLEENGDLQLESGLFLIAEIKYPQLDWSHYVKFLDEVAGEARKAVGDGKHPEQFISAINTQLFGERGFSGNESDYYTPDNSYINRVIDTRMGIPVTLSALYMMIARRLGFPAHGIGMPGHFLVGSPQLGRDLLIDPFNGGKLLTRESCETMLTRAGFSNVPKLLDPISNRKMLYRICMNLSAIYKEAGEMGMLKTVNQFAAFFNREG